MAIKMLMFLLLIVFATTFVVAARGEVYKVGGSLGWTTKGNPDYKSWAASINFHVGDTILFTYNKEHHNVVRVTHKNYNACNSSVPLATWATGNDSFTIKRPGHYYFVCGFPGHCEYGQKVDIRIPEDTGFRPVPSPPSSFGPSPSPMGLGSAGPSPSETPVPSPSEYQKKSESVSIRSSLKLWALVATQGILAVAS